MQIYRPIKLKNNKYTIPSPRGAVIRATFQSPLQLRDVGYAVHPVIYRCLFIETHYGYAVRATRYINDTAYRDLQVFIYSDTLQAM